MMKVAHQVAFEQWEEATIQEMITADITLLFLFVFVIIIII